MSSVPVGLRATTISSPASMRCRCDVRGPFGTLMLGCPDGRRGLQRDCGSSGLFQRLRLCPHGPLDFAVSASTLTNFPRCYGSFVACRQHACPPNEKRGLLRGRLKEFYVALLVRCAFRLAVRYKCFMQESAIATLPFCCIQGFVRPPERARTCVILAKHRIADTDGHAADLRERIIRGGGSTAFHDFRNGMNRRRG
jgi:hypothetical protein